MRTLIISTIVTFVWVAASSVSFAQESPPKMDPLEQRLKELNDPGSTAVGQPIDVLAPWGVPTKTAQLGQVVIYTWTFLREPVSSGTDYSGTVTPQGNVSLHEQKSKPTGCEVTVQTDVEGVIRSVKHRMINLAYGCFPPAAWWEKR